MSKSKAKKHQEIREQIENAKKVRDELEKNTTPEERKASEHERRITESRSALCRDEEPEHIRKSGNQIIRMKTAIDSISESIERKDS